MSTTKISRRYAVALFDLIQEGTDVRPALLEAATFAANEEAKAVLASPSYSDEVKSSMLNKALSSAGKEEISRLIDLLCSRGKATLLPEIASLVDEMVAQAESSIDVAVTSAIDLNADVQKALATELSSATGKKTQLVMDTDEAILGGVIIRIGDRKIDCSVRGRLDGLKKAIVS